MEPLPLQMYSRHPENGHGLKWNRQRSEDLRWSRLYSEGTTGQNQVALQTQRGQSSLVCDLR